MSEDLRGSKKVWWLIVMLLGVRRGYSIFKGLKEGISFCVFLLNLFSSLELLEDFLVYKLFCYYIQAFVCKKHLGNVICTCTNK